MTLDGLLTFESSYHALRAERALQNTAIAGKMVPAPRELSATCVVALRFPWSEAGRVTALMERQRIEIDRACHYPENTGLPAGWAGSPVIGRDLP